MGLKSYLQSRRDDAELGKGIWRRSHDRFIRVSTASTRSSNA